jgi:hypothetical protein
MQLLGADQLSDIQVGIVDCVIKNVSFQTRILGKLEFFGRHGLCTICRILSKCWTNFSAIEMVYERNNWLYKTAKSSLSKFHVARYEVSYCWGSGWLCVTQRDLGTPIEGNRGTCAAMQKYRHSNFAANAVLMYRTYLIVCLWSSTNRREGELSIRRKCRLPTTFLSRKATRGPRALVGDWVLGLPL